MSEPEPDFRAKRRQKFLTERYFELNKSALAFLMDEAQRALPQHKAQGKLDPVGEGGLFIDSLKLLKLHYTAGDSIESLKGFFSGAVSWFERWHRGYGDYIQSLAKESGEELRTDGTPVRFDDLFHFQLATEFVSLGILFGEGDAVREAAAWMSRYRKTDMLFETLLEPVVADPDNEIGEFFHQRPYDPLLDAVHNAETPLEASALVKSYLDGWYKAFEGVPWHNGHLVATDEYSNYEGYWAFEAAAICVLYDIDDSSFRDHLVYPKDLADWARSHDVAAKLAPAAGARALQLRREGGQPCPQAGYWSTPALLNSRRHFSNSELMPVIDNSTWGTTIWYWDETQK